MKKIMYAFSALIVVLTSCSNDENPTANPPNVLLKKKIEIYNNGSELTTDYSYDGNKLVTESSSNGTYKYTYSGDLITGIETFNSNDDLIRAKVFTYNSEGKLSSGIDKDFMNDYAFKETYTYNSYGTATITWYYGNLTAQTQPGGWDYKYYYANGEVIKKGYLYNEATYTYDNKNNPYKNITGIGNVQNSFGSVNGISQNVAINSEYGQNFINEYTYNSNFYPTVETKKEDGVTVKTTQYFYE